MNLTMNKAFVLAKEVVLKYALTLQTQNLEHIVSLLHPEFKFVYRLGCSGHGIRTNIRYIGHLYKTFVSMKKEGLSINPKICIATVEDLDYISILLEPPHDRRIIFPMDERIIPSARNYTPDEEVILYSRVKHGLLCKVECYFKSEFTSEIGIISDYPI